METDSTITCTIARQPVFTRTKKLFGYELLFREGSANWCPDVDGDLASNKPMELLRQSLARARFCELLSVCLANQRDIGAEAFLTGLFADLDALLDLPMEAILNQLPWSADIKEALLSRENALGGLLKLAENYEQGKWEAYGQLLRALEIIEEQVTGAYLEAIRWADATLAIL